MENVLRNNKMAVGSFLAALALLLLLPSMSWSQEAAKREEWGSRQAQYLERSDRLDEIGRETGEKDWYEDAFEEYEESPYGYYEEESFYDDFDLNYWYGDSKTDWYEKRFYQYGRGYVGKER
ncbi:MAG: hypothetical protein CVU64_18530 [Deltaproteobacteria bacterium HGW-Deltaproteobacteria-21]|jgi:hypothetical protein|nr:MAG: hypothetical protein CVU64_18530 [Deltaproteobacteria bacterium HGW-Deltaproteobacteria-21]